MSDHYVTLGVRRNASFEEIKKAYLRLVRNYHPDKLPPGTPEMVRIDASEKFLVIQNAYNVLSSSERFQYDATIGATDFETRTRHTPPKTPPSQPKDSYCRNCGSILTDATCARCTKQQSSLMFRAGRGWSALGKYFDGRYYLVLLWLLFFIVGLPGAILIPQIGIGDGGPWDSAVCGAWLVFASIGLAVILWKNGLPMFWQRVKNFCTQHPFVGNFAVQLTLLFLISLSVGTIQTTTKAKTSVESFASFVQAKRSITGQFTGSVVNTTANMTALVELAIQQSGDTLTGCFAVRPPLYGSGKVSGAIRGTAFEFVAHSSLFDIKFTGIKTGEDLNGTYTVNRGGTGPEHGSFALSRIRTLLADGITTSNCRED